MSDQQTIREKAITLARMGADEDRKQNFEDAYSLYMSAIKHFLHIIKCTHYSVEKDPVLKENLSKKTEEIMKRAEEIQEFLSKSAPKALRSSAGGQQPAERGHPQATARSQGWQRPPPDEHKEDANAGLEGAVSAIVTEKPNVKWADVAGLEVAKQALQEAVILPIRFPEMFVGRRTTWKGILLYGPPGTGKSYLAKACATEVSGAFVSVSSSDLVSKIIGESERLVRSLFEMARSNRPAIIFIDKIDSLCSNRSDEENEATGEFLVQMQRVGKKEVGLLVLGTTNTPWNLHPAVRRCFEKRIYISLPDQNARKYLFKMNIGDTPNNLTEDDYDALARETDSYSGSDIATVVRRGLMEPVRMCSGAKYFREVQERGVMKYAPCGANEPGARPTRLLDLPANSLRVPDLKAVSST
jgi:vacuolar protein-sorting-associated protein 4